jgi:hypothetical protein
VSEFDTNIFAKGIVVSDAEMAAIKLPPTEFHGEWNYTIKPCHASDGAVDAGQAFRQEIFYGRWVPSGPASWCTFMHRFELSRDLLQRPIRRRSLDAGDQSDQSIVTGLRSRAL